MSSTEKIAIGSILIGLIVLVRFAVPATSTSEELSLGSVVPFIVIGIVKLTLIAFF